uniref:ATP synthase F0 subunit 8 n=1 Tax=Hydropsyche formosana TaxID=487007 RepID=UPI0022380A1D|nr:ATP synthase F0 subunit 8 [Hydropsyche formosana]UYO79282.1 ATP synthase F0 subunit 8 [Hydropsyche formosana]
MPQMMPLNWMILMMFFMGLFFIIMNLFYFNKTMSINSSKKSSMNFNLKNNNWKW